MTFPTIRNHFRGIPRKIYNFRTNRPRYLREQICNRREQVVRAGCKLLRANCQSKYQHCGGSLQSCAEKNIRFDCKTFEVLVTKPSRAGALSSKCPSYVCRPFTTGFSEFTVDMLRKYCSDQWVQRSSVKTENFPCF